MTNSEMTEHPQPNAGAQFPLPSDQYEVFKRQKFEQDSLDLFNRLFGNEQALIDYFRDFWQSVYENRGEAYMNNLKVSVIGCPDQPLSQRPFYKATEGNFRHFLHNLNGFKTNAPWRIVLRHDPARPLPKLPPLEGALLKYGWQEVGSMVSIGFFFE